MAKTQLSKSGQSIVNTQPIDEDEWYDLLPVEKKLISFSLGLGLILLAIFIVSFGVFK